MCKTSSIIRAIALSRHDAVAQQDAESYQLMLERLERAETLAAIQRGSTEFDRGEGISLDEAEERLRKKHGFSR